MLPDEFSFGLPRGAGPVNEWFADCLALAHGDVASEQAAIRALLDRRAATQPTGQPSCGSTFRNPR